MDGDVMAKYSKNASPSEETIQESVAIARATQKPGQSKEQTKLIAQGIQKGIDQYKKQYKAKSRELDKKLKKSTTAKHNSIKEESIQPPQIIVKQHWLPWLLLLITWMVIAAYFAL